MEQELLDENGNALYQILKERKCDRMQLLNTLITEM